MARPSLHHNYRELCARKDKDARPGGWHVINTAGLALFRRPARRAAHLASLDECLDPSGKLEEAPEPFRGAPSTRFDRLL